MLKGGGVIACPVVCKGAVIVPDAAALILRDLFQNVQAFSVIAVLDVLSSRTQILIILGTLLSVGLFLTAETKAAVA